MVRFSRDKRFFLNISFAEFSNTANALEELMLEHHPGCGITVLTCEDLDTYNYSTVTFSHDEVTEGLKERKHYTLEELSEQVWDRSFAIQMTIRDPSVSESLMICLSTDRHREPRRLKFYYQSISDTLETDLDRYKHASMLYSIGDGRSQPSKFNMMFGQKITGMSLL